jgi:nucleoside-diphosphate-sugar epimerase
VEGVVMTASPSSISTAVVTGATGFIGTPLVRKLGAMGARVLCPVRRNSPRLARIAGIHGVETTELETFDANTLASVARGQTFDAVFHLAAYGVLWTERDPIAMLEGNASLTASVLVAARDWSAPRVVYAGSCSEYAPSDTGVLIDENHPLEPTTLYGAAKAASTVYGITLASHLGVPFVPLRIFGTYGVGEATTRLLPYIIDALTAGRQPELTPGEHVRDFSNIDDIVDALVVAATHPNVTPGLPYNVCSGIPRKVADVATRAAELLGSSREKLGLGRRPHRTDEPAWLVGNPARFRDATGFAPRVELDDGIRKMIEAHARGS